MGIRDATQKQICENIKDNLGLKVGQKWFVKIKGPELILTEIVELNGQVVRFNNFDLEKFGLICADGNWYCIDDIKFIQQDTRPPPPPGGGDIFD